MSYHYKQCVSCSAMSDSIPPGFFVQRFPLCPKNIGVVYHFLLQIIMGLPDPGIKPGSPALLADSLPSQPPGKPYYKQSNIKHAFNS